MPIRYPSSLQANRLRSRAGPLAFAVDDFAQQLATDGYANYSIRHKLATVANLGGWLRQQGHPTEDLSEPLVGEFLGFLHSRRNQRRLDVPTCRQLLALLRDGGHVPALYPQQADDSPIDRVARQCQDFLLVERGLRPTTAVGCLAVVHPYLRHCLGDGPVNLGHSRGRARMTSAFSDEWRQIGRIRRRSTADVGPEQVRSPLTGQLGRLAASVTVGA